MSVKEKLLRRLDELIEIGDRLEELLHDKKSFQDEYDKWTLHYQNLLNLIYDKKRLEDILENLQKGFTHKIDIARRITAILKATKEDLEKGLIGDLEHEIKRVEINNLLDYSYELFDENDDALDRCACVLSRIVLERTLQALCEKNLVPFNSKTKASVLNHNLREKGVYSVTQMKEIEYLLSIGNYASHPGDEWAKTRPLQRRKAVRDIEDLFRRFL